MQYGAVVGEKIARLRALRKWTGRQLAEKAGVSHSYLNQLERGRVPRPSVTKIRQIARALNVPVTELTGEVEPYDPTAEARNDLAGRIALVIPALRLDNPEDSLRRLASMPEEGQEIADALLRALEGHYRRASTPKREFEPVEAAEPKVIGESVEKGGNGIVSA